MPGDGDGGLGTGDTGTGILAPLDSHEKDIQNFSKIFDGIQVDASILIAHWNSQSQNDSSKSNLIDTTDTYSLQTPPNLDWSIINRADDFGWSTINYTPQPVVDLPITATSNDDWMNDPNGLSTPTDTLVDTKPEAQLMLSPADSVEALIARLTALHADVQAKKNELEGFQLDWTPPDGLSVKPPKIGQTPAENKDNATAASPDLEAFLAAQQSEHQSEQYQAILEGYAILAALRGQIAQIPPEVEGVSFQPVIQSATAFANEYASTLKAAAALLGGGGNGFWEALLNLLLQVIALLSFIEGLLSILRLLLAKQVPDPNEKPIYKEGDKHIKKGVGKPGEDATPMDLDPETAQKVLDESEPAPGNPTVRYGYHNGKMYEFRYDGAGRWHGYPVGGSKVPNSVLKDMLTDNTITQKQYKQYIKQPESDTTPIKP